MTATKINYQVLELGPLENLREYRFNGIAGRCFVGRDLRLTGCEVSLNRLPAGTGLPFVHAHKKNEELYIVLAGSGTFYVEWMAGSSRSGREA